MRKSAGSAGVMLLGFGQSVSGVQDPVVGILMMVLGGGMAAYFFLTDERVRQRIGRRFRWRITRRPATPLERVVARRLAAAEAIERDRRVGGDGGYFDAVVRWAGETSEALHAANAGELAIEFDKGIIDGSDGVAGTAAYMDGRIRLLKGALARLRR